MNHITALAIGYFINGVSSVIANFRLTSLEKELGNIKRRNGVDKLQVMEEAAYRDARRTRDRELTEQLEKLQERQAILDRLGSEELHELMQMARERASNRKMKEVFEAEDQKKADFDRLVDRVASAVSERLEKKNGRPDATAS